MENQPVKIFISYAHEDESLKDRLEKHLLALKRTGLIEIWNERGIYAGQDWDEEIHRNLRESEIILFLVSANFLSSDYINQRELRRSIELYENEQVVLIPIILRPCDWYNSPLGRFSALPRGGMPITKWDSQDEAFLSITKGIKNAVEDVRARKRSVIIVENQTISTSDKRINIGNIFKTAGIPNFTFVKPIEYNRLKDELKTMGKGLAIEGPSGIGKTTLVKKAFEEIKGKDFVWIKGTSSEDVNQLNDILNDEDLGNHPKYLFIDDFHHINFETRKEAAKRIKELVDTNAPSKIIVIGINKVGYSLMSDFGELAGRVSILPVEKQSDETIGKVISAGEEVANIKFKKKREIIEVANGSYFTAQLLCLHLAYHANITESQPRRKTIEYSPYDVMSKVLKELEFKYREPLNHFATIDFDQDVKGGCLTLIWLLKEKKQGYIRIDESSLQYPELKPTFNWLENNGLQTEFDKNEQLKKIFHYDSKVKMIAIEDPQLEFYLDNISWSEFANRTGHMISFSEEGKLKVHCIKPKKGKKKSSSVNHHLQWWKIAGLIGLLAGILLIIIFLIPKDWFIVKIAIIVSIGVTIFIGLRNPKTRFIRAFWSVFGLFSFAHILPAFGIEATGSEFWVKIVTEGPGAVFNIVVGCILIALLILDKLEQSPEKLKVN